MLLGPGEDIQGYVPRPAAWTNFMGSTSPNDPFGPGVFPTIKRLSAWTVHKDPASGNNFYQNTDTGETTWVKPEGFKTGVFDSFNQHQVHINKVTNKKREGSMMCIHQRSSCQWRFMF